MIKNFIIGKQLGGPYYAILWADRKLEITEMKELYDTAEAKLFDENRDYFFCDVMDLICKENPGWHWEDWEDAYEALDVAYDEW